MGYTASFHYKVNCPVVAIADGERYEFSSLDDFKAYEFEKRYVVDSISAEDNKLILNLAENKTYLRTDTFENPDAVSFF